MVESERPVGDLQPKCALLPDRAARRLVVLLCASVALMMSGYGIVIPVFAKRVAEMNEGAGLLGFMAMAFAAGQILAAPLMGMLADWVGRKPVILLSLVGFTLAESAFFLSQSSAALVSIQFANGLVTSGLLPASMGVVGDLFSEDNRARWTGIVMSSYAAGFVLGPAVGGVVCDQWGSAAPFVLSACLGLVATVFAAWMLPETRVGRTRKCLRTSTEVARRWNALLPAPVECFLVMLALDFFVVLAFAAVEPVLMLYAYEGLSLGAAQLGAMVGAYGLSMAASQVVLGGTSDRVGRMPVIVIGFLLNATFYIGVIVTSSFWAVFAVAAIAGVGNGLVTPALGAAYLDLAGEDERGRVIGMKEAAGALGSFVGPLMVAILGNRVGPHEVFGFAAVTTLAAALLGALVLHRLPRRVATPPVEA